MEGGIKEQKAAKTPRKFLKCYHKKATVAHHLCLDV